MPKFKLHEVLDPKQHTDHDMNYAFVLGLVIGILATHVAQWLF